MAALKLNLVKKFGVPESFPYLIFGLGVCLILAFFMPSADFGIIKTPAANDAAAIYLLITGILLLLITFLFFIPFFSEAASQNAPEYYLISEDFQRDLSKNILAAKNEIIFWGGNFYSSTEERSDDLLNRLAEGVNIKYLIFNPASSLKEEASRDFGENTNKFETQCKITITNLIDLQSRWDTKKKSVKNKGELEVKLYKNVPRLRAYFFDPENTNSHSFFVHFLYHTDSSQLPMFKIINSKESAFLNYLNSFRSHWQADNVVTLAQYLQENKI